MNNHINPQTISEAEEYLKSKAAEQENPPEWISKSWDKLTFEPFVEDRNNERFAVHIGNSGLRVGYIKNSTIAEMHFFPHGNPSPEFASELNLEVSNSRNFVYGIYELATWINTQNLSWDQIKIDPEPKLGALIERLFPNIILSKEPSTDYIDGFIYTINCQKLIEYTLSEEFLNSATYKVIKHLKEKEDSWPNMINPLLSADLNEGMIDLEF